MVTVTLDRTEENMLSFLSPRNGLYDEKAGAWNETPSPGLNYSLELGSPIELCSSQLMSTKHARNQTPVAMSDIILLSQLSVALMCSV